MSSNIDFINVDPSGILTTILTTLENGCGEPLFPGDERRIFGESALAPLFVALFNAVNDACRQRLLRYARGEVLDALGENNHCERHQADKATTTLRFSLASALGYNVVIPEGIRVTGEGKYFASEETAVITAGDLYVDVEGVAIAGGTEYNGISPGGINEIVDLYLAPQLSSVTNTDETSGGTDIESDNAYRNRIRMSGNALSTAGPEAAYRYYAISADPDNIADAVVNIYKTSVSKTLKPLYDQLALIGDPAYFCFLGGDDFDLDTLVVCKSGTTTPAVIDTDYSVDYTDGLLTIAELSGGSIENEDIDVTITKTVGGTVEITPVKYDGTVPDQSLLDKVLATVTDPQIKPLTDNVIVQAPTTQSFDIELTYYTTAAEESACIATVEGDGGAIDQYIAWQQGGLNRDINPDMLSKLILAPEGDGAVGATRVVITKPVYTDLSSTVLAQFSGSKVVTHVVKEGVN